MAWPERSVVKLHFGFGQQSEITAAHFAGWASAASPQQMVSPMRGDDNYKCLGHLESEESEAQEDGANKASELIGSFSD